MSYSGKLLSPYGLMNVGGTKYANGWRVENNRIVGESRDHYVPDHWICHEDDFELLSREPAAVLKDMKGGV